MVIENGQPVITNEQRISKKNRLVSLEKRLERNLVLEKTYKETINQYISKGYARKLTQNETRNTSDITNFIPHHCVLNPKKPDRVRQSLTL